MSSIHLFLLVLFSTIIAQDYYGRCPEQSDLLTRTIEELDTFYITPDSTFMIHYDTSGVLIPEDMSDDNNNGIPNYIESIGIAADSAKFILNIMGFKEAILDEDGIYDIYIDIPHSSNGGLWGGTLPSGNNSSYMRLRQDYSGLSDYCNNLHDLVWLTVGHEYFHAVQLAYNDFSTEKYFKEFTSMWFENVFVPDCFDFLDFTSPLFDSPEQNFDSQPSSGTHGYSLALYGHYLGRIIDQEGTENQINGNIMQEIWHEYYETGSTALEAINEVLYQKYEQKSFIETWTDFISRNLYSGIYDDLNNEFYYHEGQIYLNKNPISTTSGIISDDPINFDLILDSRSVVIQSYQIGSLESLLTINHSHNDFIGRIAIVSTSNDSVENNLFWGNVQTNEFISTSSAIIHFVYGVDGSTVPLNIELIANTVPLPPNMLLGTAAQDSIILHWSPSLGPGDNLEYVIYRNSEIIDDQISDTNYVDSDAIMALTNYIYMVTCKNEHGESQPSNAVSIQSWPDEANVSDNKILSIYPNPVHKTNNSYILYALGSDYSNITLELINIRGQILTTISLQSDERGWHRERINSLVSPKSTAGIYFIRMRPDYAYGSTQKITILP